MSAGTPFTTQALDLARKLGSSTLYEASGLPTSAVDPAIRPVWPGASVAGPAYPVECAPGDNLAIHVAMEKAPSGSILVVLVVADDDGVIVIPAAQAEATLAKGRLARTRKR
jgi:4-hydroxy-4-methyl-2-oxoglutarate aldolase